MVARLSGVNVQTLRYYERRGLLAEPERGPSGYREYPAEAVRRIRFIKRVQELGFTLAGIVGVGWSTRSHLLESPTDVDVDAEGNLYVVDWGNHRIQQFRPSGSSVGRAGSTTTGGIR